MTAMNMHIYDVKKTEIRLFLPENRAYMMVFTVGPGSLPETNMNIWVFPNSGVPHLTVFETLMTLGTDEVRDLAKDWWDEVSPDLVGVPTDE
jgi:hypothetical protein